MAKLYFYYAAMNAGKSTTLLQADFNYRERGMNTMLWTSAMDTREGQGRIGSRIGLEAKAFAFSDDASILATVMREKGKRHVDCLLVDEAQFLTQRHVLELVEIVDGLDIPVLCYGLRTDFQGRLFPGSAALLALADKLVELKAVCECGAKAMMNLRVDQDGFAVNEGPQAEVGGNDRYVALCRRHFFAALREAEGIERQLGLDIPRPPQNG